MRCTRRRSCSNACKFCFISSCKSRYSSDKRASLASSTWLFDSCVALSADRALSAYLSVDDDSMADRAPGATVAMMTVLHLPPSASAVSRVSLESRYGMRGSLLASALMTRPRL